MQSERDFDLLDAEPLGEVIGQLLQRAERAQPAAEHAPSPEQHTDGNKAPECEHHWIKQEQLPAKTGQKCVNEGQHVDDR